MEQIVNERIMGLISRDKIPVYRFEKALSYYAMTDILLRQTYMGHISL